MITTAPQTAPDHSNVAMSQEVLPLLGFIAVAGPPPFIALGALVFGSLMLVGPFAVIVTLVAAMAVVVTAAVVIAGAVVAVAMSPFLAARHIREHRVGNPFVLPINRARVGARSARVAS
jgi:hypothetical protein